PCRRESTRSGSSRGWRCVPPEGFPFAAFRERLVRTPDENRGTKLRAKLRPVRRLRWSPGNGRRFGPSSFEPFRERLRRSFFRKRMPSAFRPLHGFFDFTVCGLFLDILPLVAFLLSFSESDLDLRSSLLKVHAKRNDRHSVANLRSVKTFDL